MSSSESWKLVSTQVSYTCWRHGTPAVSSLCPALPCDIHVVPDDVGKRYCAFYVIGCLSLAFGGILAYGLMQMDGIQGKEGWRWIFIMEGVVSLHSELQL